MTVPMVRRSVGPDLSRLWDTATVEKILEAIVEPSKEIKEGFQTYRLTTVDSKVYTGLKVKDDAKEVVIREATGRDIRLAGGREPGEGRRDAGDDRGVAAGL